jgi:hypothetical protein
MGMHHRLHVGTFRVNREMQAVFRRRTGLARQLPAAMVDHHHARRLKMSERNAAGGHQHALIAESGAEIAVGSGHQPASVNLAADRDHRFA